MILMMSEPAAKNRKERLKGQQDVQDHSLRMNSMVP